MKKKGRPTNSRSELKMVADEVLTELSSIAMNEMAKMIKGSRGNYAESTKAIGKIIRMITNNFSPEVFTVLKRKLQKKIIAIETLDGKVLVDLGDWTSTDSILGKGWEKGLMSLCRQLVHRGDTVLDIGAHNGNYTVLFAAAVGDSGSVHAFEPVPSNIELLRGTIALNHLKARVIVEPMALSDSNGEVLLFPFKKSDQLVRYPEESGMLHSIIQGKGYSSKSAISVPMATLDDYADKNNIDSVDFVKIDTEGAEVRIVQGAKKLFKRSPNLTLLIETHPGELKADHSSIKHLIKLLHSLDLSVFHFEAQMRPVKPGDNGETIGAGHLLATRRELAIQWKPSSSTTSN